MPFRRERSSWTWGKTLSCTTSPPAHQPSISRVLSWAPRLTEVFAHLFDVFGKSRCSSTHHHLHLPQLGFLLKPPENRNEEDKHEKKCHKRTHWCNLKLEDTRIPKFYGKIHGERLIQKELKENHTILTGVPYCTLRQPHCISLLCRASLRSHSCNHRPCQWGSHWAHLATAMSDGCLTAKPMDFLETWHGPATPQRHHCHGTSSQYEQYFHSSPKQSLIRVHFQHLPTFQRTVQVGQPDIWTLLGARFRRGTVRDAPPRPALDQWDQCHPWDPHESNGIQWDPMGSCLGTCL